MKNKNDKMDYLLETEWILTLAYYVFNKSTAVKKANLRVFTAALNAYTEKNRTPASIEIRVCNFRSLDPEFLGTGLKNNGKSVELYWNKYVLNDTSLSILAEKYSCFLNATIEKHEPIDKQVIPKSRVISTIEYYRSSQIKQETLKRAAGNCDLCGNPAPFLTFDGNPYLEVHHLIPFSEGGVDVCKNTVALCPNCHRKAHYANLSKDEKDKLKKYQ